MAYDPIDDNDNYGFFETGIVVKCEPKDATCSVQRAEGGLLENIPILNTMRGGGQSTDISWMGKLVGCHVLLINIQGVLCVLATIPTMGTTSAAIR